MSLIELVIAVALIAVVGAGMAAMLMGIWNGQSTATAVTEATTRGSTAANMLERAVRGAVAIHSDGTTLRVRTAYADERRCQGFSDADGVLRFAQGSGALPAVSSWPVFYGGPTETVFALSGTSVDYTLDFRGSAKETGAAVVLEGTVSARVTALEPGGAPCW
ncbi:hypothetical protein AOA12_01955 [Microbacterium sp. No. 7]|nr:hypothetical protein AOA12_01955 [Microbacterium sp. No. 7]